MKRMLFAISVASCLIGCTSTRTSFSAGSEPEPTVAELNQQVKDLKARLLVLELDRKVREQRKAEAAKHREFLASNRVNRVRSKSKLVAQPKTTENMNLLGERFPVRTWQIRKDNLDGLKFKRKPKVVTPLTRDGRTPPPPKSETSINEAVKKEEDK